MPAFLELWMTGSDFRGDENNEPSWQRPTSQGEVSINEIRIGELHSGTSAISDPFVSHFWGKERTPDKSPFIYQILTALRSTTFEDPLLTYIEIQGFLETIEPRPRAGVFGINDPGQGIFSSAEVNTSYHRLLTALSSLQVNPRLT